MVEHVFLEAIYIYFFQCIFQKRECYKIVFDLFCESVINQSYLKITYLRTLFDKFVYSIDQEETQEASV